MKSLNNYINNENINEGLKDSFINIFKNFFSHGEVSNKELVTIHCDPKVFGSLVRDKDYFNPQKNNDYPKLIPSSTTVDDLWELHHLEMGEDKYGNETSIFTYIGHADFRKDKDTLEVDKNYQEFVEKILEKYK